MKKKSTIRKSGSLLGIMLSRWEFNQRFFTVLMCFILFLGSFSKSSAQTFLTVPDTNSGSAFIGPFGNAGRHLQLIIDDSLLTSLVGKNLTGISFRLPASTAASWPTNALTMNTFDIYLSNAVEPADRQLDFAANIVGTQTKVRSGSLQIPAGALTVGSDPNNFSFKILFTSAWLYEGGNLLIDIQHSGTGISSRTVHAVPSSDAGYGTLFSALWQSTGNVLQGNFTYVEITADGLLGSNSVSIGGKSVIYPNPAKDELFVKSNKDFVSFSIYNAAGQLIVSKKISGNPNINVSGLAAGNYLLKLTDKHGNIETSLFLKK